MIKSEEEKNSKTVTDRAPSELLSKEFRREINLVKIGSGSLILSFTFFLIVTIINAIRVITEIFGNVITIITTTFQSLFASLLVIGIIFLSIGLHRLTNFFPDRFKLNFIISYLLLDSIIIFGLILEIITNVFVIFMENIQIIALLYVIEIVITSVCITISLILLAFTLNQLKRIDGMNVWLLITPLISIIVPILILGSGIAYLVSGIRVSEITFFVSLCLFSLIELGAFLELLLVFNRIEPKKVIGHIY